LTVIVKELPPVQGEKRLGRAGRKHSTIKATLEKLAARRAEAAAASSSSSSAATATAE
jgi:hypothetical protein